MMARPRPPTVITWVDHSEKLVKIQLQHCIISQGEDEMVKNRKPYPAIHHDSNCYDLRPLWRESRHADAPAHPQFQLLNAIIAKRSQSIDGSWGVYTQPASQYPTFLT